MINKECNLLLSDLYFYDIEACSYNLLNNSGWKNKEKIDYENKEKRNVQIGLERRDNKLFSELIMNDMLNIIKLYVIENNIQPNEIINTQSDGFIITKKIVNDITNPVKFRYKINKMIINIERTSFLYVNENGKVEVKGVKNKPLDISFYNMFKNINFTNKNKIIDSLDSIRNSIINSNNKNWFSFQSNEDIMIPIIDEGLIKFNKSSMNYIDINDIDKLFLWEEYVWPFIKPIVIDINNSNKYKQ